ncbi:unnamed protein product [Bursaphelenchus okinawaensis]|uniref:Protein kinase domain-containing protein n=1 Tax=Bursaphelenchus okinawaensis TaxID=465554 RepID=A0A811L3T7_9BILA|nr:unnamed protein product [Bursaphelenchus okinawaensis]CAG9118786.1 unnamed protein product [Bursaphelenchus okinawaensis]
MSRRPCSSKYDSNGNKKLEDVAMSDISKTFYSLNHHFANGGQCQVYHCRFNEETAVIKVYKQRRSNAVDRELFAVKHLTQFFNKCGLKFSPQYYDEGFTRQRYPFIVSERLGRCIREINDYNRIYTVGTVLRIAMKSLNNLRLIHAAGFVVRDVKSANFCFQRGFHERDYNVVCCDFGYATQAAQVGLDINVINSMEKYRRGYVFGTYAYAPIAAHYINVDQVPFDDMESWFYMVLHLLKFRRGFDSLEEKYDFWLNPTPNLGILDELFFFMRNLRRSQPFPYEEVMHILRRAQAILPFKDPTEEPYLVTPEDKAHIRTLFPDYNMVYEKRQTSEK